MELDTRGRPARQISEGWQSSPHSNPLSVPGPYRQPSCERAQSLPTFETPTSTSDGSSVGGFDSGSWRFDVLRRVVDAVVPPNTPAAPASSPSIPPQSHRVFSQTITTQKTTGL